MSVTGPRSTPARCRSRRRSTPALVFAGTPDDVWDQLKSFYDHVGGFGHLLMMGQGGHISHEDTVDNLTLFSKEVLPRLAELG